jgi:hypothetical protein
VSEGRVPRWLARLAVRAAARVCLSAGRHSGLDLGAVAQIEGYYVSWAASNWLSEPTAKAARILSLALDAEDDVVEGLLARIWILTAREEQAR